MIGGAWRSRASAAVVTFAVAILAATGCGGVDRAKLEPCYRAAKEIEGAVGVGLTYSKLGELVQRLNTEVGIARDAHPNAAEAKAIDLYAGAVDIYADSLALWKEH